MTLSFAEDWTYPLDKNMPITDETTGDYIIFKEGQVIKNTLKENMTRVTLDVFVKCP